MVLSVNHPSLLSQNARPDLQWGEQPAPYPCVPSTFHFLSYHNMEDVENPDFRQSFQENGCGIEGEGRSHRLWKVYLGSWSAVCRGSRVAWKVNGGSTREERRGD